MKCKYCGCTDDKACLGGCSWIDKEVCSNCVINVTNLQKEILAYISDSEVKSVEVLITNKNKATSKLKVMCFNRKLSTRGYRK